MVEILDIKKGGGMKKKRITFKKQISFINACREILGLSLSEAVDVYKYARYIKSKNHQAIVKLCARRGKDEEKD